AGGGDHLAGGLGSGCRARGGAGAPGCETGQHAARYPAGSGRSRVPVGLRAFQGGPVPGRLDWQRPVDGRAVQYALACSAFELLTGAPPFRLDDVLAVIYAQTSEPPPLLTSRRP